MIDRADVIAKQVGKRLKGERIARQLTQMALASRLTAVGLPTSDKTVSAWETGRTALTIPDLWPLAAALNMDPGQLGRKLGLCGEPSQREIAIAEGADLLHELAEEPPEMAATIVGWWRQSFEIVRLNRLGRTN